MKTIWLGTSWKMNKTRAEALAYCETLIGQLPAVLHETIQPFFIPSFTAIQPVTACLQTHRLPWLTGGQNMSEQDSGALTGEISASMLVDAGATLVELGHSERRANFNETDEKINKKVHAALRHGLRPLICIGDTAEEKAWQVSSETVIRQAKIALHGLSVSEAQKCIIAYEPVWAIGEHGTPAMPEEAGEIHSILRRALCEKFGESAGAQIPLLYGGSVNQQNAVTLLQQADIDGLFIGRAAWDAVGYCQIVARVVQDLILKAR